MSIRTNYGYSSNKGIPGGLVDMSARKVNTRTAEETIRFGMGVVRGTSAGVQVKRPVAASTAAQFEGVAVNGGTNEFDLDGKLVVNAAGTLSVMRWGSVWVRTPADLTIAYGDDVYLITSGDDAGCFTNAAAESSDDFTTVAIKGMFLKADSSAGIAAVELFNQAQEVAAAASEAASDSNGDGATD